MRYRLEYVVLSITEDVKLLEGITSNTLAAPKNAFLNRHGKIVSTFYQVPQENGMLLIFPHSAFIRVMTHIMPYAKLSKARIEKKKMHVYLSDTQEGDYAIADHESYIILSKQELESTVSESECNNFRLTHTIPLQDKDYTDEMVLNVSDEFVSFNKGCYLGQEVVTRIHSRAKPAKKLVVIELAQLNEFQKEKVTSEYEGKGFLFVKNE